MKKTIIAVFLALAVVIVPFTANAAQNDVRVFVNGAEVDFGSTGPVIRNSRTLAPARSIFGSAGAEIEWDARNKKVSVTLDGRKMELWVGNKQAKYSTSEGSKLLMSDAAPVIINGSTYVPLSIIAESLGGDVEWNDTERAAYFTFGGAETEVVAAETPEAQETPETAEGTEAAETPEAQETVVSSSTIERKGEYEIQNLPYEMVISGLRVSVGDTSETADKNFGKPSYQSESVYGYAWREVNYGKDNYALLGINSGSVVALYSNSKKVPIAGITPGMSAAQLNNAVGAELELESKSKIISRDGIITVYRSSVDDYSVIAVMAQKTGQTSYALQKITNEFFTESTERQLIGIINNERFNKGISALAKDETLSSMARSHSVSMAQGNYLESTDKSGKTPFDRMKANNIEAYEMASENIGRGVFDAIEIYFEWMNDRSYSANIIDEHYNYVGAGVAPCPNNQKMYFTVDLIEK